MHSYAAPFRGKADGKTLYQILGVGKNATSEQIDAAYDAGLDKIERETQKAFDPTLSSFARNLDRAFFVLSRVQGRRAYDDFLKLQTEKLQPSDGVNHLDKIDHAMKIARKARGERARLTLEDLLKATTPPKSKSKAPSNEKPKAKSPEVNRPNSPEAPPPRPPQPETKHTPPPPPPSPERTVDPATEVIRPALFGSGKNLYEAIGVHKDAPEGVISAVHRKLSRKYHPDMISDATPEEKEIAKDRYQFAQRTALFLLKENVRAAYDKFIEQSAPSNATIHLELLEIAINDVKKRNEGEIKRFALLDLLAAVRTRADNIEATRKYQERTKAYREQYERDLADRLAREKESLARAERARQQREAEELAAHRRRIEEQVRQAEVQRRFDKNVDETTGYRSDFTCRRNWAKVAAVVGTGGAVLTATGAGYLWYRASKAASK